MKNWITVNELDENLQRIKLYTAPDENGRTEFSARHLPGSHFITLEADLTGSKETGEGRHPLPDMQGFAERMMELGIGADSPVLIYSNGMNMAMYRLWWMLNAVGAMDVKLLYDMKGEWKDLPVIPGDAPEDFAKGQGLFFDEERIVKRDEVDTISKSGEATLIDSRDARRYNGIEDTMDHVPGHIPGAVNYPYEDLLNENPPTFDEIESHFRALDNKPLVVYCGSGVSAPWNILLLDEIGRDSVLYPGSFSDWITVKDYKIEK